MSNTKERGIKMIKVVCASQHALHVTRHQTLAFFLMAYELEDPLAALMISSAKHLEGDV
jgi:hypothetical protein